MKIASFIQTVLYLAQTATGLIIMFFFGVHFSGVSSVNIGMFNFYIEHVTKDNFFMKLIVFTLFSIIAFHGLNGLRITTRYFANAEGVRKYLTDMNHEQSFLWYVQFISGMVILFLTPYHLYASYFAEHVNSAQMATAHLQNMNYLASMSVLLIAIIIHGLNGVRTFFVKYDILTKYEQNIKVTLIVLGIFMICLGMSNLLILAH